MTRSIDRDAACHCGQLRLRLAGAPQLVSSCHCQACQRRTGAVFGSSSFFAKNQVVATAGEHRTYRRQGDSGAWLVFHFCPTCGSNVFWENARLPDIVNVAVGAFADSDFPAPARTVWTQTKHAWVGFPAEIPNYPKNPWRAMTPGNARERRDDRAATLPAPRRSPDPPSVSCLWSRVPTTQR
jgi:hypothetical protein